MTLSKSRTTFVTWTHTLVCLSGVLSPVCNGNISITRPPTLSHIFNIITRTWSSSSVSEPPVLLLLHLPITYISDILKKEIVPNHCFVSYFVFCCLRLCFCLFLFCFIGFCFYVIAHSKEANKHFLPTLSC